MAKLLVIGSPSLDTIHINNQTHHTVGGAGMYVAMAARRSGVAVSLFGLRLSPIPQGMEDFANDLEDWLGPMVSLECIPHFEIAHDGNQATYQVAETESEENMDFNLLPDNLDSYDAVHITAMGDANTQLQCLQNCQARCVKLISIGTWLGSINDNPETSKKLLQAADIFFMNEAEAVALFGSVAAVHGHPGQILFVTRADKGALVVQGEHRTEIPSKIVEKTVDPTGAGESFCGAALANVLLGVHPVMAGKQAAALAAETITGIGATVLIEADPPPQVMLDDRVEINTTQVKRISEIVKHLPAAEPFNFVSNDLPPINHPHALDYFFTAILQQFSFWEEDNGQYKKPLIAKIDGEVRKGSSYLFYAFMRPLEQDPGFYTPERQAIVTLEEMGEIFRSDEGTVQMPALEMHVQQANHYGRDMIALGWSPKGLMQQTQRSSTPLKTLMMMLDHIGGYKEDPLRKKSGLLALCLSARPEGFLKFSKNEAVAPVVDYHCMRSALRIGLVNILDQSLREKLAGRMLVTPEEEWAVRYATYQVLKQVVVLSGKPIGAVDWLFFNYMRSHCPEMTEPVCSTCVLDAVCSKRKALFQPVLRTTFY